MENQINEGHKTEKNFSTSKKEAQKKLMESAASEKQLGEKNESSTEIYGKKIETCAKNEAGKQ